MLLCDAAHATDTDSSLSCLSLVFICVCDRITHTVTRLAKPIADSLVSSLPLLRAHWLALLRDYAVLTNTSPHARKAFKPVFFSRTTAAEVRTQNGCGHTHAHTHT